MQRTKSLGMHRIKKTGSVVIARAGIQSQNGRIFTLPDKVLIHIFSYFEKPEELMKLGLTCSRFYMVSSSDALWRPFYLKNHYLFSSNFKKYRFFLIS